MQPTGPNSHDICIRNPDHYACALPPVCTYGGYYPNCAPPPDCEFGGTYPDCHPPCRYGGTYPNCRPCPVGYETQGGRCVLTSATRAGVSSPGWVLEGNDSRDGVTLRFIVSLNRDATHEVRVGVRTVEGTATRPEDYVTNSGTVTIDAGDRRAYFHVGVVEDEVFEPDETMSLTITSINTSMPGVDRTVGDTATAGIRNDDPGPPENLSVTCVGGQVDASWDQGWDPPATLGSLWRYLILYRYAGDNGGYWTQSGRLTYHSRRVGVGTTSVRTYVKAQYRMLRSDGTTYTADSRQAYVSVTCVPPVEAQLSAAAYSAVEGTPIGFVVELDEASTVDVVVDYATVGVTAGEPGDFLAPSGRVTIPAGDIRATVSVFTVQDLFDEPDETLTVTLTSVRGGTLGALVEAEGTIVDDDPPPVVSVTPAVLDVDEDRSVALDPPRDFNRDGILESEFKFSLWLRFSVMLSGPSEATVSVRVGTVDGTAVGTAGRCAPFSADNDGTQDYRTSNQTVTFTPGDVAETFEVSTCADDVPEPAETFTVTLTGPVGVEVSATAGTATGTINDNDTPPVQAQLGAAAYSAVEGSPIGFVVELDAASTVDVVVDYATVGVTAVEPEDFLAPSGQVTIPAGDTRATVGVLTVQDRVDEPPETLTLTLTGVSGGILGARTAADGTIIDDDPPPVASIAPVVVAVDEDAATPLTPPMDLNGDGTLETEIHNGSRLRFSVGLDRPSASTVTVAAGTADATAAGTGACPAFSGDNTGSEDYRTVSRTVTFTPGDVTSTFDVLACADEAAEPDETFTVTLTSPAGATVSATAGTATATLRDNDTPAVVGGLRLVCVEAGGVFTLTASWTAPAGGAPGYRARISDNPLRGAGATIGSSTGSATALTAAAPAAGTYWAYVTPTGLRYPGGAELSVSGVCVPLGPPNGPVLPTNVIGGLVGVRYFVVTANYDAVFEVTLDALPPVGTTRQFDVTTASGPACVGTIVEGPTTACVPAGVYLPAPPAQVVFTDTDLVATVTIPTFSDTSFGARARLMVVTFTDAVNTSVPPLEVLVLIRPPLIGRL